MAPARALILSLSILLGAVSARAEGTSVPFGSFKADPTLPVEVVSESLDVNQADGSAEFIGKVVVTQGQMRLSADRVLVIYDQQAKGIERLEAEGNVLLVNGPEAAAEADRADYTIDSGVVILTGNVLLTQGPSTLSSNRATVDLVSGTASMEGRVKTILRTEQN